MIYPVSWGLVSLTWLGHRSGPSEGIVVDTEVYMRILRFRLRVLDKEVGRPNMDTIITDEKDGLGASKTRVIFGNRKWMKKSMIYVN